ncbi:MAG: UDP-glucose/GDP-mannose dehydrogenase family protein [Thermoplasmata archaeon]
MRISVIGAGYVGLATAVMFGKLGHRVECCDIDEQKVKSVASGRLPFHEPPLERELNKLVRLGKLTATAETAESVIDSQAVFICVQTPSLPSGRIDIAPLKSACKNIGRGLKTSEGYKVVVVKSTVVPGTTDTTVIPLLEKTSGRCAGRDFGVCVNPEFLQEGSALRDSLHPSRIVVGADDVKAARLVVRLYAPIRAPKITTDLRSAEMIKYASNVFLATKISYANEIANMCARFGIDSEQVLRAVGLDPRIGPLFLKPGLGFGGSCLPKDVRALDKAARSKGYRSRLLPALMAINDAQPSEGVRLLESALGDLRGKRVAVLGLAFKGGVDDTRDTRAVPLIAQLLAKGAHVVAFDPMAMSSFIMLMPGIEYAKSVAECLKGADGCIVQADWPEFRKLGRREFSAMHTPVVVDGRRCLDPAAVRRAGARYLGIGYGSVGR